MTVLFPPPQFPSALLEVGPIEDPAILLRGEAVIAGVLHAVIAIRIDAISMSADFRGDLPRQAYANCRVQDMLEDLGAHTEITDDSLVHLTSGRYVVVMIPSSEEALG